MSYVKLVDYDSDSEDAGPTDGVKSAAKCVSVEERVSADSSFKPRRVMIVGKTSANTSGVETLSNENVSTDASASGSGASIRPGDRKCGSTSVKVSRGSRI